MPIMTWTPALSVGIDSLDAQHKKWIDTLNQLFDAMKRGQTMLMAWVDLAPQIPGMDHPNAPGALMAAEAGHITLDG